MTRGVARLAWFALLLFLSGAAALVYQLLWIKQLSLVVGVDVYAITIAIGAFFAGLALGSAAFGRRADGARRPLRVYAALEAGVALLGVGATVALAHTAAPFAAFERAAGSLAWLLPFALVGVPACLMGGTLPVLMRALPRDAAVAGAGGTLYAANTAGAVAGSLLTPFLLIPHLGVRGAALAAAALNLAAALGSAALDRSMSPSPPLPPRDDTPRPTAEARLALALYAVAGGVALGYEVIWSHVTVELTSTRSFAFAIVLATYLTGLAIGSGLYARVADRVRDPWGVFATLVAGAGLVAFAEVAVVGPWLMHRQSDVEELLRSLTGSELAAMCGRFAVAAAGIVFVPTLLLGAAFPAALRLAAGPSRPAGGVGRVLALNTAGGIAGTLATGFLAIPILGVVRALACLAIASAAIGLVAVLRGHRVAASSRALVLAAGAAVAALTLTTPTDRLARLLPLTRSGGELVYYAESPGGTAAVVEQRTPGGSSRRLYIRGVSNSGDTLTSLRYMRLQALLPLIVHRGEPRSALVIGLGTGITAGALAVYPGLGRRVCAELLPAVVEAAPLFHGNFDATRNPAIEIRVRDGRRELLRSEDRYDVITLEPPPPSAAGVVNLYSQDFYELARTRLNPGGLLAQWWPLPTQNDEDSQALVRSFLGAFPYAALWTTEIHEMLLVGSNEPLELEAARIAARFEQPGVAAALREVGIASPAALLATWITHRGGLKRYAAGAPPVTDDRPAIEYATWTRRGEFERVLPRVLALSSPPPLRGADATLLAAVGAERRTLMAFYDAALHASRGDRDAWSRAMRQVMTADPTNPYYRWMAGLPAN